MAVEAAALKDLGDVRSLQARFVWTRDDSYGFPTIVDVFRNYVPGARLIKGDCASAAVLGQWSLSNIGIPATKYMLWSSNAPVGHSICISDDHRIVIGNISVVEIEPGDNWQANVFALWNGAYDRMDVVG